MGQIPFPDKKYQIIYADCPWSYKVWSEDKTQAQGYAKRYYQTMTTQEICDLPVKQLLLPDTKLFLWATPPCLIYAFQVMAAWGFQYKTIAFVWVKLNKSNRSYNMFFHEKDIFYGIGHWTASNIEVVLAGLLPGGRLNRGASVSQVVHAPLTKHSEKPNEIRRRIVTLCGDLPRIELFARERVDGWDAWGNEV